uniref:Uncharacterized protein n=1 Tax=Triticum aestivum TaxID=4565 RepID=A0A077S4K3_WHEAT|nr:unnamed protein product [Triticum aestivum]
MACTNMVVALKTSDNWQITDASLLRWWKELKRAAQDYTAWAVQRFERPADSAAEFMRFVQLGGTRRHNLFFDPLIRHIFAGQTLMYEVFSLRGQYRHFTTQPMGFEEHGLEALLSFIYEDYKQPKNSFWLGVMLHLSESTNKIGTTVNCLRLVTPHFKSTADVVIKEITQLPTQDFSCVAHMEHWNNVHTTLTRWFRPDPLCCQGYDSCHDNSESSSRNGGQKLRLSSIFPELVCQGQPQLLVMTTPILWRIFCPLKLGILLLPHDSLEEDPTSAGTAVEVIDGEKQNNLTHVDVHPDQLDEMLLPKAIYYLHHNADTTTYQICWRSNHGSAHLCMEKVLGACGATRRGRNDKSTRSHPQVQQAKKLK